MRLSLRVLQWQAEHEGWTASHPPSAHRAYRIWSHAEWRLGAADEFARIDALTTLKRAVDQRLRRLTELYEFKNVPLNDIPNRVLDQLSYFGIVRPLMLRKLFEIRNLIEHRDEAPPSQNASEELVEFVWYFLRSTDRFVRSIPGVLVFSPDLGGDSPYWLSVTTGPAHQWAVKADGLVPAEFTTCSEAESVFVEAEHLSTVEERLPERRLVLDGFREGPEPHADDVCFRGTVSGPPAALRLLYQRYLFPELVPESLSPAG